MSWVQEAWQQIESKVQRTSRRIGASFPHVSNNGRYDNAHPEWWTNGFWPGLLWLMYRENQDDTFKQIAVELEAKMDGPLHAFHQLHHDVGFMWSLSSVANYKLTGDEASRTRGLIAASHLAGRFNIQGDFIRAWPNWDGEDHTGWAIIDCMMNLPLLFWASEISEDPRFSHIAKAHADMVMREFVRPDGSVHHIVCFDPFTGERVDALGGQGYGPCSAWARGASWAIYGFALCYRYTQETRYLDTAKRVAHFFIANLQDDYVPYWDFRAPLEDPMPLDTSAAACAASGMLEIARLAKPEEAEPYRNAAEKILKSLYENYGAWDGDEEGLILMATGHRPANSNINVPIIYGDYYFVEGITKLKGRTELFW